MPRVLPAGFDMERFIIGIPKAEIHLHIEGSLEPETMFALAVRNKLDLRFNSAEEVRAAYQFTNLQSFLDIYYEGAQVLITEQDFYDLTWAYITRVAQDNVRHAEIFFDPQTHTERGISFETVVSGISRALEDARAKLNISSRLIMCFLRHLSAESAMQTLEASVPFKHLIYAVGLDSSEVGNPPSKFEEVFRRAREYGYLVVAHAGEEGPAEYISQAITLLKALRIDHGVRCLEDQELVQLLVKERIPLTVCPLSNIKLCVFACMEQHNLKQLLLANLLATVNSDDPAYFGGYIAANFIAAQKALALTVDDIIQLAKNSFEASFLSRGEKEAYCAEIDSYVARELTVA